MSTKTTEIITVGNEEVLEQKTTSITEVHFSKQDLLDSKTDLINELAKVDEMLGKFSD